MTWIRSCCPCRPLKCIKTLLHEPHDALAYPKCTAQLCHEPYLFKHLLCQEMLIQLIKDVTVQLTFNICFKLFTSEQNPIVIQIFKNQSCIVPQDMVQKVLIPHSVQNFEFLFVCLTQLLTTSKLAPNQGDSILISPLEYFIPLRKLLPTLVFTPNTQSFLPTSIIQQFLRFIISL